MNSAGKSALSVAVVVLVVSLAHLLHSRAMQGMRPVDLLAVFSVGVAMGVVLCLGLIDRRRRF